MANQPKPAPKPEPKPEPKPAPRPGPAGPSQPAAASGPEPMHDERDDPGPDHDRGRDKKGQIPGTPTTPPEGHDHAEPAPGEPGGPSGPSPKGGKPPPPVKTSADEQRERSAEIMTAGVEEWKAEHDERTDEEKAGNKQVLGVASPAPSAESQSWEGSSRTTQAARNAQNPAASR